MDRAQLGACVLPDQEIREWIADEARKECVLKTFIIASLGLELFFYLFIPSTIYLFICAHIHIYTYSYMKTCVMPSCRYCHEKKFEKFTNKYMILI